MDGDIAPLHALAAIAISEDACKGRDDGRRNEPQEEDEPDGALTSLSVGVDGDGDEKAPVADRRRGPRALEPAEIRIPEHSRKRPSRLANMGSEPAHARSMSLPLAKMKGNREDSQLEVGLVGCINPSNRREEKSMSLESVESVESLESIEGAEAAAAPAQDVEAHSLESVESVESVESLESVE